jgi:co-chaperonin GroES (HSP10)
MTLPVSLPEGLPRPAGYRILIAIPKKDEKIGSILLPETLRKAEESASIVGMVIALGDLAYSEVDKYPSGPWCEPGDWVIFRAYSGTRMKISDEEFRLLNDDSIEAVVDDPRTITRAF